MKLSIVRIIVLSINLVHIPICILAAVVDVVIICALVPGLLWARILNINASIKINITCLINIAVINNITIILAVTLISS